MNMEERKALAKELESKVDEILAALTNALRTKFPENHPRLAQTVIVSFAVGTKDDHRNLTAFEGTPCPTKCEVLPDGRIQCRPVCS